MEGILALMIPLAPFIMVVALVWMNNQKKLEEKRLDAAANSSAEQAALRATNIAELEKRIEVLERIVTDRGYDVATQIEALRDARDHDADEAGTPMSFDKRENA